MTFACRLDRITCESLIRINGFRTGQCFSAIYFNMKAPGNLTDGVGNLRPAEALRGRRQSREARAEFWGLALVSSFFIIVLGTSLFLGTVMVVGTLREDDSSNGLAENGRTGRIARTLPNGTLCHYVVFDNKTAQTVEDRIGRCDESRPKPKEQKPAAFSWGGN